MIISGNSQIDKVYYSGYTITKIYSCGGSLVWEMTPTPPTGGKYVGYYIGGTSYSEECDGNSRLTTATTKSYSAPSYTALTSAVVGNCITTIYLTAFYNCSNLSSITMSDNVTLLDQGAFSQCSKLKRFNSNTDGEFILPSGTTVISGGTFQSCSGMTSLYMYDNVTTIGNDCFNICTNLRTVRLSNSLTAISQSSFSSCHSLSSITIPDSVTSIGDSAFHYCSAMTTVHIGSGITSIGEAAFQVCSSLRSITIEAVNPPTLGTHALVNTNNCDIFVPCSSVEAYKQSSYWSEFSSRIKPIAGTCETIYRWVDLDPTVDYYCSGVAKQYKQKKQESTDGGETWTDVSPAEYQRGDIVEYISSDCGYDNTGRINFMENMTTNSSTTTCITSFTVVNSSKSLCNFDISGDTVCGMRGISGGYVRRKVRSVAFPNNTKTIEANAFTKNEDYDSNKKKLILFNEGLETIGDFAFSEFVGGDVDDSMLGVLIIPSTVTYIGHDAFNFDGTAFSSGSKNGWLHIYFKGTTPPTMADDLFGGIGETQMNSQIILYVPQGTLQAYTDALPSNYKAVSNPMAIVEYTESGYPYENDMYNLYLQLQSQGFLSN